jgi:hypothetical protein
MSELKPFLQDTGDRSDFYLRFSPEFQRFYRRFRTREDTILRILSKAGVQGMVPQAESTLVEEIPAVGRTNPLRVLTVSKPAKSVNQFE